MLGQLRDYLAPERKLKRELRAFETRSRENAATHEEGRYLELLAAMTRAHKRRSSDELSEIARQKARLEEFCAWRLFLPHAGLEELMPQLLHLGFTFLPHDDQLIATLFPDGWRLEPVSHRESSTALPTRAALVMPDGTAWAMLEYGVNSGVFTAQIWR